MDGTVTGVPLDSVARTIQMALTPVFLLTGIATLLNVVSTKLGRVHDLMRRLAAQLDEVPPGEVKRALNLRRLRLRRRSTILVGALVSGTLAGTSTCGAILTFFVGALRDRSAATVLFVLFGLAVVCTTGSLLAFLVEALLSWLGLELEAAPLGPARDPGA